MVDLAVVVISTNEAHWLGPCLRSVFEHAGGVELDVVVADNMSTDGTRELVERDFPQARVVQCENRGFGHANNRGWETTDSRYVLFLNPDTEVLDGSFDELVAWMDAHPAAAVAGVKQVLPGGTIYPTVRRFPSPVRAVGQALGADRLPSRLAAPFRERELDLARYDEEFSCDWVIGSFMFCRSSVLRQTGVFDERFFIYSEEVDLCLRIRQAGHEVIHRPAMTIVHHLHSGAEMSPRMQRQNAWSEVLYGRKHFSGLRRAIFVGAVRLRHLRRFLTSRGERRETARGVLATVSGRQPPPFADLTG